MAPSRRMVDEYVADVEVAKKHFYVPAMSLEALSAIRRRCWDMEALFSVFHVGDVGVGVVWSGRGCRLGCGGCVCVPTLPMPVLLPEHERTMKEPGPRPSECA